jgi:hypothetical protein
MKEVRGRTSSSGEARNAYGISMGISEEKKSFGRV